MSREHNEGDDADMEISEFDAGTFARHAQRRSIAATKAPARPMIELLRATPELVGLAAGAAEAPLAAALPAAPMTEAPCVARVVAEAEVVVGAADVTVTVL